MEKVSFTEMKNGTKEDYLFLEKYEKEYVAKTADRILKFMSELTETLKGYQEMVVATLLHDVGDELAPMNHSEYAAAILKQYVSEKTHWIIEKHGEFQAYYYVHHLGGNRNMREKYKDHKYYQATIDFCEKYDQISFDPNYKSLPLEHFEPMVRKIFSRKPYSG